MYRARDYVFLTPSALGRRRYRAVCAEFDLEPLTSGYGALLCHDENGVEVTKLTREPDYLRMIVVTMWRLPTLRETGRASLEATQVDPMRFPLTRPGWPTRFCRCRF
jgi:hypothetical protein